MADGSTRPTRSTSALAVITNVDLDHQKYLGNTIEQIANEKAAIIKPGNRVVTGCEGVALAIVEEHARRGGCGSAVAARPRDHVRVHITRLVGPRR